MTTAWSVLLILPIHAAVNPFLYTFAVGDNRLNLVTFLKHLIIVTPPTTEENIKTGPQVPRVRRDTASSALAAAGVTLIAPAAQL